MDTRLLISNMFLPVHVYIKTWKFLSLITCQPQGQRRKYFTWIRRKIVSVLCSDVKVISKFWSESPPLYPHLLHPPFEHTLDDSCATTTVPLCRTKRGKKGHKFALKSLSRLLSIFPNVLEVVSSSKEYFRNIIHVYTFVSATNSWINLSANKINYINI